MTRIRAKYQHGTFTPTQPEKLKEGSVVDILIEIPDEIRQRHDPRKAYELLVTTDFVIDETLTLLRVRGETKLALDMGGGFSVAN